MKNITQNIKNKVKNVNWKGVGKTAGSVWLMRLALLSPLTLNNCNYPDNYDMNGTYNGYPVHIFSNGKGESISMKDPKYEDSEIYETALYALDYNISQNRANFNGDGRYDEIRLNNVPLGHDFEKFVHLDSLKKIKKHVKAQDKQTKYIQNQKLKGGQK